MRQRLHRARSWNVWVPIRRSDNVSSWKGGNILFSEETGVEGILCFEFGGLEQRVKLARKQDEWIGFVIEESCSPSCASEAIQVLTVSTEDCDMSVNGDSFEKRIGTGVSEPPKCEVAVVE